MNRDKCGVFHRCTGHCELTEITALKLAYFFNCHEKHQCRWLPAAASLSVGNEIGWIDTSIATGSSV